MKKTTILYKGSARNFNAFIALLLEQNRYNTFGDMMQDFREART